MAKKTYKKQKPIAQRAAVEPRKQKPDTARRAAVIAMALSAALAAAGGWRWTHRPHPPVSATEAARRQAAPSVAVAGAGRASFADEAQCAACHAAEAKAWTGSHHDLAMQDPSASTVLGDFSGKEFVHLGIQSRFFQDDGGFWINATGSDGNPADFRVKYTFGVAPVQQYLLELPRGRLQAYTVAWDSQGKRWFDLYPEERIDFGDELHWTGLAQNWNYMCAECHSTGLHKNFDAVTDSYMTSFARVDVGCQACHGPASKHLQWAAQHPDAHAPAIEAGLEVDLGARDPTVQIEGCARCHSRRALFWGDYQYGGRLMDTHLPSLLEEQLYEADGQIEGEVYEYGSFLQSRMYAKGVRCSDCHDPHALKTRATGNALCLTCHSATTPNTRASIDTAGLKHKNYDSPAHHFHRPGTPGAQCVNCHMASRTYMVIDPRRDHSFRIPRPDLSVQLGTPNACNACHANKDATWAAAAVAKWYGPDRRKEGHYGEALAAGRGGQPGADARLVALARDVSQPGIVRATALELLQRYPGELANNTFRDELALGDPLIRWAALEGLEALPPARRVALVRPLLGDPVRAVRIEAARLLAPVSPNELGEDFRPAFDAALAEYVSAQIENADRPDGHLNLGNLYASQGRAAEAETEFRKAIALDAHFVPAYVNLADLQRAQRQDEAAEQTLRAGLHSVADNASLHYALGLTLVRQKRYSDAVSELALAARYAPEQVRYTFVYGVALHDAGRYGESLAVLGDALKRHPGNRQVLQALASYSAENGDKAAALSYAQQLRQIEGRDVR